MSTWKPADLERVKRIIERALQGAKERGEIHEHNRMDYDKSDCTYFGVKTSEDGHHVSIEVDWV